MKRMKTETDNVAEVKEILTCRMAFRVSEHDHMTIKLKAEVCGIPISEYVRRCAVGHLPKKRLSTYEAKAYITLAESRGDLIHIKNALKNLSAQDRIQCFKNPVRMRKWVDATDKMISRWEEIERELLDKP